MPDYEAEYVTFIKDDWRMTGGGKLTILECIKENCIITVHDSNNKEHRMTFRKSGKLFLHVIENKPLFTWNNNDLI